MKQFNKDNFIEFLLLNADYTLEEATEHVKSARIVTYKDTHLVNYPNGIIDIVKDGLFGHYRVLTLEEKINLTLSLADGFLYPETYPHTGKVMWKVNSFWTNYRKDKIVLNPVDEGFEKSLNLAIWVLIERREQYYADCEMEVQQTCRYTF